MIQLETGRGIGFCLIARVKRNWQRFLALMQGAFLNSWWNVFRALASGAKGWGFESLLAYKRNIFKNNTKNTENQPLRGTPNNAK